MPRQTRHARQLLALAAHSVLMPDLSGCGAASRGCHFADGGSPEGGTTGAPPAKPKEEPKGDADKLTLTKDELKAQIDEALKADREAAAAKAKADKEAADKLAAEEQAKKTGDFEALEKSLKEKASAAERRAQIAEVNTQLRDHLADKHPEYLANAADIMLHVKEQLDADAKPEAVAKLIEAQAKAFVDRTPKAKGNGYPGPTPSGAPRGANVPPAKQNTNGNRATLTPASRF
jgi:hypothetical protein